MSTDNIREIVKQKYGEAALRVQGAGSSCCCGGSAAVGGGCDPITSNLYSAQQSGEVPGEALQASLGCGNPTALGRRFLGAGLTPADVAQRYRFIYNWADAYRQAAEDWDKNGASYTPLPSGGTPHKRRHP